MQKYLALEENNVVFKDIIVNTNKVMYTFTLSRIN